MSDPKEPVDPFAEELASLDDALRGGRPTVSAPGLARERHILELLNEAFPASSGRESSTAQTSPKQIGRFVIISRLGEGAFGTVYRAFDPHLGREVALKVAKWHEGDIQQKAKRFLREAKVAASLRHPAIVPLYEFGEDAGVLFLAFALIPGNTLQSELATRPQIRELRTLATIVAGIADGLAFAHASGIIHRDVKPANVMIDATGSPLLMDFGLASFGDDAERLTQSGQVLGTPLYMSPEQAGGALAVHPENSSPVAATNVTSASDQYSLGVILYELLTGRPPFLGKPEAVILQHLHAQPSRPSTHDRRIPRELDVICLKALEKEPTNRYRDCHEFADDLRRWLAREPIKARPESRLKAMVREVRRRPARFGLLASLILVVSVSLIAWRLKKGSDEITNAANRLEYGNHVAGAMQALRDDRQANAGELLDLAKAKIAPTAPGLEWDILMRMARRPGQFIASHPERANVAAYSNNRKWLATGGVGKANVICLWDVKTGAKIRELPGHIHELRGLDFSADDALLASIDGLGQARLWRMEDGASLGHCRGAELAEGYRIRFLRDSPDRSARLILSRGNDAEVLEVPELKSLKRFPRPDKVEALAVSPDGKFVAMGARSEPQIVIYESTRWNEVERLQVAGKGTLLCVAFSHDGRRLIASFATKLLMWNLGSNLHANSPPTKNEKKLEATELIAEMVLLDYGAEVRTIEFLPDNERVISPTHNSDNGIEIFDLKLKRRDFRVFDPRVKTDHVWQFALSVDGLSVAVPGESINKEGIVTRFDLHSPTRCERVIKAHIRPAFGLAFTPDGHHVATVGEDFGAHLWSVETGEKVRSFRPQAGSVYDVAISPDGTKLATCDDLMKAIRVFDMETAKLLATATGHTKRIERLVFSPDSQTIISASWDHTARIWSAQTGHELANLPHDASVHGLVAHPDGHRIFTASGDSIVQCWDKQGNLLKKYEGHRVGSPRDLALSPDRQFLACADLGGAVTRLNVDTGLVAGRTIDRGGTRIAIAPDGRTLVAGFRAPGSGGIVIFDIESNRTLFTSDCSSAVRAIRYSHDGKSLAAVCEDGTLHLWRSLDHD